jgi:hypothetical protein
VALRIRACAWRREASPDVFAIFVVPVPIPCGSHPFLFSPYLWTWGGTQSTVTAAIYWHIVPAVYDNDDCVAISGLNERQGKPKYSEKTCLSDALSTADPT